MSDISENGGVSLDVDSEMVITGKSIMGGLTAELTAEGVPPELGRPLFQLTFFASEVYGIGHVCINIDEQVSLQDIHKILVDYINRSAKAAIEGNYGVRQDIVDRFPDAPKT